ncbi:MAG: hypothetical protein DI536_27815 [Archangium gephyra]|uniref:Cellulose-binding domain protein n=1 Tax=Archangium gephyra TaxID=48 RepID=A0A2W5UV99_9BACT|nr:MAG: hypothetical protein DI536_27815 [Archangium gephyra]
MSVKTRALITSLMLLGCEAKFMPGGDGEAPVTPGEESDGGRQPWFTCVDGADPSPEVVLRLTRTQYRNALEALLTRAYPANQVQALLSSTEMTAFFAALPVDGHTQRAELTYDSMDQRVSSVLVNPQFEIATALGAWIEGDSGRLQTFMRAYGGTTACADVNSDACITAFIENFGLHALRRPVDSDDAAHYRESFDDTGWGRHKGLIASMLLAPDFIFRTEFRGDAIDGRSDFTKLTAYETASRVSFALTNSAPDDELLAAAARDFTGAGYTLDEQLTRIMATPGAKAQFDHFFRQWIRADRVNGINPTAASALTLNYPDDSAPSLPADTDLNQLRADALDEMVELMSWYAQRGSLKDALLSDVSFARSATLARVYGVQAWDGTEENLVHFPEGQRAGLFTRAGYMLSGYPDTNPVMRGARLRVEYLCDVMEPPADISPPAGYMPPAVPTVRNVIEAKTQISGSSCQGCHQSSINPLGFPFESYDAFGRYRTQEPLFDMGGSVSRWEPVNATTRPDIDRNGSRDVASDGVALSRLLADSQRLQACYARHAFRYLQGRHEKLTNNEDGCVLNDMERAAGTGSLQDVVKALTNSRDFTRRRMPAGN